MNKSDNSNSSKTDELHFSNYRDKNTQELINVSNLQDRIDMTNSINISNLEDSY
jgi:hypothetical protein